VTYLHEGRLRRVAARREVILAGGTFSTPQLLMLSGIGDPAHLAAHGIGVTYPLPGVGRNLQDRYEVSVVSRMREPWRTLRGATYSTGDVPYRRWRRWRIGPYVSNGLLLSVVFPSKSDVRLADLFCFSVIADFQGYFPGYSEAIRSRDYLSWVILKAYTHNDTGTVRLRSSDPLAQPDIRFRYFDDGNADPTAADRSASGSFGQNAAHDLDAMVTGVRFVRKVTDSMRDLVDEEVTPGRHLYTREQIATYIRDNVWGHHACGTCAMKPETEGGVVDSRFRVHGIRGLRIVDASVFPRIPGYFIVASVFMIAEKAADDILQPSAEPRCGLGIGRGSAALDVARPTA
jgi:choline dehydrogenase